MPCLLKFAIKLEKMEDEGLDLHISIIDVVQSEDSRDIILKNVLYYHTCIYAQYNTICIQIVYKIVIGIISIITCTCLSYKLHCM